MLALLRRDKMLETGYRYVTGTTLDRPETYFPSLQQVVPGGRPTQAGSLCYFTPSPRHAGCVGIALGQRSTVGRQCKIGFQPVPACTNCPHRLEAYATLRPRLATRGVSG
jgi:hypothetical protein